MSAPYLDPLIPPDETNEAALQRLALNITTLSGLIEAAAHQGRLHLAAVFTHTRQTKVSEARACMGKMHVVEQLRSVETPPSQDQP